MKKINMIVGKKQIVLAALVVILGVAVYLNWEFAKNDGQFDITAGTTSDKNYGDAALVNQTDDYFTQAHLDKQKTRDAPYRETTEKKPAVYDSRFFIFLYY